MDALKSVAGGSSPRIWGLTCWCVAQDLAWAGSWLRLQVKGNDISWFKWQWKNMLSLSALFPALHQLCIQSSRFTQIYFPGKLTTERKKIPSLWDLPTKIPCERTSWNLSLHTPCSCHRSLSLACVAVLAHSGYSRKKMLNALWHPIVEKGNLWSYL